MHSEDEKFLFRLTEQYIKRVRAGQRPRIEEYVAQYPHLAEAFIEFIAYYDTVEEPFECSIEVLPLSLLVQANGKVLSESELAQRLRLSVDIVRLLERRQLVSASIPFKLYQHIAAILGYPLTAIQSYCQQSPIRSFYSETREIQCQQRYTRVAEASVTYRVIEVQQKFPIVLQQSDQLSQDDRDYWLRTLDKE